MILPYLDYRDIFFINANSDQLKKLQSLQNRALKICFSTQPNINIEALHQTLLLPKLDIRREAHMVNFMFKLKNDVRYLTVRNIRTRLHEAPVFNTVKPNREKFKQNVFYYGAMKWNGLSVDIRNIASYDEFKSVTKRWAIHKLF